MVLICGCASPVPALWPPAADAPVTTIFISLDTWHAVIAFPRHDSGTSELDHEAVEEWGYAERAWYLDGRQGVGGALRAMLWPTEGVVEVGEHPDVWARRTPQPPADLYAFRLSKEGAVRLRRHLASTIASEALVALVNGTRFYSATDRYHLFHTCHQYAAAALHEAGLPVSTILAFSRSSLAWQLSLAVRIAHNASIASATRIPETN